jgi:hypothetical protein
MLARSIEPSVRVGPTTALLPRDVERNMDNLVTKDRGRRITM